MKVAVHNRKENEEKKATLTLGWFEGFEKEDTNKEVLYIRKTQTRN